MYLFSLRYGEIIFHNERVCISENLWFLTIITDLLVLSNNSSVLGLNAVSDWFPAPKIKIADLSFDNDLLEKVRLYVDYISKNDPKLVKNKTKNLRNLLYLFERDVAIKTLKAG